ncbi:MAG: PAS domain S-box protein, partial [Chloroflexota bacterium]|nr:PAS domain S-box protein [Chloroflexota bacterium]
MKMNLRPWKHSQPKAAYESNKEQDKYISLVNSIRGFSAIVDRDGMLQFATEDPLQKFGYQKDEMIGKPFWDASWFALSSESRRIMENGVLDALEGENVSCTVQTFAKDGTSLPVTFNIRPVPAEGEDIISIVTDVQDVNEHKQGFGTKKSSLASLHPIIDITNGTHYQTDKDGNLTSIGAPAITLLGYNSPDELIGRNITLFWDNPEEEILFLSQLNTHKKVQGFRTTFKKPDGTLVAVEIDSQQILDVDGQVLGNKGSFRDADIIQGTVDIEMPSSDTTVIGPTEAMPVSEALLEDQRSEEVLSTLLLESAADGIAVVEHGTITMANHKLGMMLGCNRIDLVDTSFNDLLSPDSRRVMAERHERRVAGED